MSSSSVARARRVLTFVLFPAPVVAIVVASACGGSSSSPTSPSTTAVTVTGSGATNLTYTANIQPIMTSDCVRCHGPGLASGGYDLSTYEGVLRTVSAGNDASRLIRVTQPGGLMYGNLTGDRNAKAGIIYDWVVNSKAAR